MGLSDSVWQVIRLGTGKYDPGKKKMDDLDLIRIKTFGSVQDPVRMKRPTT